ncbi:MAG TPA: glycoside hydrolase family 3 N-terminal domain-containing protein [Solirubrobacteraceae bacterium]|nr:glycoside hydrolase family 3 N-terminal domain-containing protein [Solirubrobacteraceae bacterium]
MPARRVPARRAPDVRARLLAVGVLVGALVFVVVVALTLGGGERAPERPAPGEASRPTPEREEAAARGAPVDDLSLDEQVGSLVVLRFAGTTLPDYVERILGDGEAAGVILFADNLTGPGQARALTKSIQRAASGDALIMVDQEGGPVRNLPWLGPAQAASEQGGSAAVRATSRQAGRALADQGFNVVLGPVADVPSVPGSALAGRGFSTDPQIAGERVAAAVRGWQEGGVVATLKHFPGLGAATTNTDDGPATVKGGREELPDLVAFRAGLKADPGLVMLSSARYPGLDPDMLALAAPVIVGDLLRDALGFDGVVITDSLESRAVQARLTVEEAAVGSVQAGGDIALTTGRGSWIRVFRAVGDRARSDENFRARVRESAARVLELKRSAGRGGS